MDINLPGVVLAAICAAMAFAVARWITVARRKRQQTRETANAQTLQSRQVRRAMARKQKR